MEPFTAKIAEHLRGHLCGASTEGNLIRQNDIAVAATARSLSFDVLVGPKDEAHFRQVEGVGVRIFGS